jgi:ribokinase
VDNPEIKLAFQPGMYHLMWGAEKMKDFYKRAEVVIMNREEAVTVTDGNHGNINDLIDKLHALGPKIVVVTDGPEGAYASDGRARLKMPLYPDPGPPVDRTGAGDAFASTFVAALIKGNTIEGALQWAPINSMAVCQKVGAQAGLLTERQLDFYLRHSPRHYQPTPLDG